MEELGSSDIVIAAESEPRDQPAPAKVTRPARKKRLPISGNNIVLAAMFVGGVVAVYILKLSMQPDMASAKQRSAELKVDAAIAQMASPKPVAPGLATAKSVVETLRNDAFDRQIPAWAVGKNPFIFKVPRKKKPEDRSAVETTPGWNMGNDIELAKAEALSNVRGLELQTTMIAAEPIAMISGRSITKGRTVRGWTVVSIESTRVTLTWRSKDGKHGLKYVLSMEGHPQR